MALVDYEAAWRALQGELLGVRQGIGIDRLLALMGRMEAEHRIPEGQVERALRLYGVELAEDLRTRGLDPAPTEALAPPLDGPRAAPSTDSQEGTSWHPHRPQHPRSPTPSPAKALT